MMLQQPTSRSQRNKGSKAKKLLQASMLVAIVLWLFYETRHTYDSKKENSETGYFKLSEGDVDIYFGRKVNPGSQGNSYETNEVTESGGDLVEAFDLHMEEKAAEEAFKKENEESHQDTTDTSEEQAKDGNVDDSADPHTTKEEVLRLPSETDSDVTDESRIENRADGSNEENGAQKDVDSSGNGNGEATASYEETVRSTDDTETHKNSEKESTESGDTGSEHKDDAMSGSEEKVDKEVHDRETVELQGDDPSDTDRESSKVEALEKDKVESQRANGGEADTNEQEDATAKSSTAGNGEVIEKQAESNSVPNTSEAENGNLPNSAEEHNGALQDSSGAHQGEEIKNQETMSYSEAATTDTRSDSEKNSAEKTENNESGQINAEKPENNEASGREAIESEGSNVSGTEATANSTVEDATSNDEVANASVNNKDEHLELPSNSEDAKLEGVRSAVDAALNDENSGNESLEGAKPDSNASNNDNGEDGALGAESIGENNALEVATAVADSIAVANSSLDNKTMPSLGTEIEDMEQKGNNRSESSSSVEKKSVEL